MQQYFPRRVSPPYINITVFMYSFLWRHQQNRTIRTISTATHSARLSPGVIYVAARWHGVVVCEPYPLPLGPLVSSRSDYPQSAPLWRDQWVVVTSGVWYQARSVARRAGSGITWELVKLCLTILLLSLL